MNLSYDQDDTKDDWQQIRQHAKALGFGSIDVTDCDLSSYHKHYHEWTENHFHGDMGYMTKHGDKRLYPEQLVPNTQCAIVVTLDYLTQKIDLKQVKQALSNRSEKAVMSQYALGRDYHKVIRKKLQSLANYITTLYPEHQYRVFTDSAPVLEKPLAEKAGIGIIGKHGNLLNKHHGSFFFIGVIYTNIPFETKQKKLEDICGKCSACIKICPTNAIVSPKVVDARKCISYLTIENKGVIPIEFRKAIGTRIYGCDDCQLICPWNKYASLTKEKDFFPKAFFTSPNLIDLFSWTEAEFLKNTEGSAIRRIGYHCWQRNLAIALGNAPYSKKLLTTLQESLTITVDLIVRESIEWALMQHKS